MYFNIYQLQLQLRGLTTASFIETSANLTQSFGVFARSSFHLKSPKCSSTMPNWTVSTMSNTPLVLFKASIITRTSWVLPHQRPQPLSCNACGRMWKGLAPLQYGKTSHRPSWQSPLDPWRTYVFFPMIPWSLASIYTTVCLSRRFTTRQHAHLQSFMFKTDVPHRRSKTPSFAGFISLNRPPSFRFRLPLNLLTVTFCATDIPSINQEASGETHFLNQFW